LDDQISPAPGWRRRIRRIRTVTGISWQITPRTLTDALAAGGVEAKRAFEALMTMQKIDIAAIEAARRG
jgi:predicted 3-demethylubiquinone-9 3-methyltransferase (glyoxalase superfamily)